MREATVRIGALGFTEVILWVVPENDRARALCASERWTADGALTREEFRGPAGSVTVVEIRYRRPLP